MRPSYVQSEKGNSGRVLRLLRRGWEVRGGGGGGRAACGAAAAGAGGGAAGLRKMIWAARREVLEGGRPAPWCCGRAYRDMSVGWMAGLRSVSQRTGFSCRAREFCAHLRAAERSFRAAFERRREGFAWLEVARKAVCMALFGGILIFSDLQRLTKFCAARRGAAMV